MGTILDTIRSQATQASDQVAKAKPTDWKTTLLVSLIVALATILGVTLWQQRAVLAELLTPENETLTELYFADHLNLPNQVYLRQPMEIPITIHSLQRYPLTHRLSVTAYTPGATLSARLGSYDVTVNPDESKTLETINLLPLNFLGRIKIEYLLQPLDLKLHYYVNVVPFATPSAEASTAADLL